MIEISMTEEEGQALLDKLVHEPAGSPLANVYSNTMYKLINNGPMWAHIKKNLLV